MRGETLKKGKSAHRTPLALNGAFSWWVYLVSYWHSFCSRTGCWGRCL